jgi:hypothetical protein
MLGFGTATSFDAGRIPGVDHRQSPGLAVPPTEVGDGGDTTRMILT